MKLLELIMHSSMGTSKLATSRVVRVGLLSITLINLLTSILVGHPDLYSSSSKNPTFRKRSNKVHAFFCNNSINT